LPALPSQGTSKDRVGQREGDLPLLVEHFVRRFSRELGKSARTVAPETVEILSQYSWPGNVRELQSVLKQAILQATGPVIAPPVAGDHA